jgi:hypothetical protein
MRKFAGLLFVLGAIAVAAGCGGDDNATDQAARSGTPARSVATSLPLYTTGTQWGRNGARTATSTRSRTGTT